MSDHDLIEKLKRQVVLLAKATERGCYDTRSMVWDDSVSGEEYETCRYCNGLRQSIDHFAHTPNCPVLLAQEVLAQYDRPE